MRARLIKFVTFIAGLYFFLEFILPAFVLEKIGVDSAHENISQGVVLVGVMAAGLGIINLFMVHGAKIAFRRKGWVNSVALLLGLIFMMAVAIADWAATYRVEKSGTQLDMLSQFATRIATDIEAETPTTLPAPERLALLKDTAAAELGKLDAEIASRLAENQGLTDPLLVTYKEGYSASKARLADVLAATTTEQESLATAASALTETQVAARQLFQFLYDNSTTKHLWDLLFDGFFVALGSAMFSLLGVYIAAAAYRAFRVRTFESSLMMGAAVLVMLGQIPFGVWIYDGMPDIRQWLLEYPNSASFRAIKIGAAVAGLVMSLRMWLSLESDYSVAEDA